MDARQATGLGLRLLGIFFAVLGTVTVAGLVDIFTLEGGRFISGFDQARFVGWKVVAGGAQLVGGILLFRFADRIARATPGLDRDAPALRDHLAVVGFTLMGMFFMIRGSSAMTMVVQFFGGGSSHASIFGTIVTSAAVQIGAGFLLWRSAGRFAAAVPGAGPGSTDRVRISVIVVVLIGAAAVVLGAVDLTGWLVFDVISTFDSPGRSPDFLKLVPTLVKLGLGVALIRGASRVAMRAEASRDHA